MATNEREVVVVGGGPVGALLSLFLAKAGQQVTVLERSQESTGLFSGAGQSVNITLCERGLHALDAVGLGDRIRRLCSPCLGRQIHLSDTREFFQPYGNDEEALWSISRGTLASELVAASSACQGVDVRRDHTVTHVDIEKGELGVLSGGSPTLMRGQRYFAADGCYSVVRQAMQRRRRFDFSQQFHDQGYRELTLSNDSRERAGLRLDALHIWPRGDVMLIGFPNLDGSLTLALHLPFEGSLSFDSIRDVEGLQRLFASSFHNLAPYITRGALERIFEQSPQAMVTVKCRPWSVGGRFCLVGDAAHAFLPSYGQGANSGFEDCQVLDRCLRSHPGDWGRALREYEDDRRPDTDVIADLAVEHYGVLSDLVAQPRFQLQAQVERKVQRAFPELSSLYYNVAFTRLSYRKSVEVAERQRRLVSLLMEDPQVENLLIDDSRFFHRAEFCYRELLRPDGAQQPWGQVCA